MRNASLPSLFCFLKQDADFLREAPREAQVCLVCLVILDFNICFFELIVAVCLFRFQHSLHVRHLDFRDRFSFRLIVERDIAERGRTVVDVLA